MRGDLQFDANFECGNLDNAKQVSKFEYELHLRPDYHNTKHRLWFYFTIKNADRGQKVLFTVPNMSKGRSSYRDGMTPIVCSTLRPTWQRLPRSQVINTACVVSKCGDRKLRPNIFISS